MLDFNDLKQIINEQEQNAELFQQHELDNELKQLKAEQIRLKNEQIKKQLNPDTQTPKTSKNQDIAFLVAVCISVVAIVIQALAFIFLLK